MATKTKIVLEVPQGDYDVEAVTKKALEDAKKNNKGKIESFNVYIKPEENKAYYTANKDTITGSVDLY